MNPAIEAKQVTKEIGGKKIVNQLSFTINKGEVFGLLGPNGAGKTTTIETLLGIKRPDQGSTKILGLDPLKRRREVFERVGVQLQSSSYQNNIRVGELCREISSLYKEPRDYQELLNLFKLERFEAQPVEKLSGGEKQKLSIVLALIPDPEIIFLDELTTGLDTEARRNVWQTLLKLKETQLTIFLTTHYMEEAEILCDRLFLIKRGNMVAEGTVSELLAESCQNNLEDAYLWYVGEDEDE
ncbi:ABC transporter ATP-binding protein [Enterococcus hulanensis]|uniref:ABC transporter ATP-binding protein n=1 Tax=Enterococcus hulanensis TaxID=2559929 RepID=A0ABU3EX10_9ENTE|nr:ABC transporter ATP-binding protein [Enterococcus hulanensis]MDT2599405.1 ABC transporter ATP-binding protein [Enterococcus hulanensis]MDT2608812.1 ABC transporter ATP-binding protein [Enterococcus hulanensis]MDT2616567.1 ABC transporter ATP-binding protein [Enterococcus hulanensis]MDT2627393.1 ABC transporter ATP-binding protein [Enterococcus hulanensis]MDT2657259.1 ABC transporter ATP-binding protein [Enterococcus hulanensis]